MPRGAWCVVKYSKMQAKVDVGASYGRGGPAAGRREAELGRRHPRVGDVLMECKDVLGGQQPQKHMKA